MEKSHRMDLSASQPRGGKLLSSTTDLTLTLTEPRPKKGHFFTLCHVNARSVCNKSQELCDFIQDQKLNVLAITETWLHGGIQDDPILAELVPTGYTICQIPRESRGGGVAFIYKTDILVTKRPAANHSSFECMEILVHTSPTLHLVVVYRAPTSPLSLFFDEFGSYLADLVLSSGKLLLVGDCNIHLDKNDNKTIDFLSVLQSMGLRQYVNKPTHRAGHTIDVLIHSEENDLDINVDVKDYCFSDHFPTFCTLKRLAKHKRPQRFISMRNYKSIDHEAVAVDLQSTDSFSASNLTQEQYDSMLTGVLDKHAPARNIRVTVRHASPWMNGDILQAKRLKRKYEATWRRTGLEIHRQQYKNQRNELNEKIRSAKSLYYHNKIEECGNDQKALFGVIKNIMQPPKASTPLTDERQADNFNTFFVEKIEKIHSTFPELEPAQSHNNANAFTPSLSTWRPVDEQEVRNVVMKSPTKSCSLDPWPTWMVKQHSQLLIPFMTDIINASLRSGEFPSKWKHALVTPALKKPSLDPMQLSNYRPVSNLAFLSKTLERVAVKQLTSYFNENELLPTYQSAYRAGHSVETALLRVRNDILQALDNHKCVLLVLLDLSAAFDTISHATLLQRLHQRFGITGTVQEWCRSYLSQRTQSVVFNGKTSSTLALPFGVPQGSVLGPVLFTAYTTPLADVAAAHSIHLHLYADDTQLYLAFNAEDGQNATGVMNACIDDIQSWMTQNKLKLNDSKTELLVITPPRLLTSPNIALHVGDAAVNPSLTVRNLGTQFHHNASMTDHIKNVSKSCFYYLRNIARIRHMLTQDATEKLVHSLISTRLDYCNSLLAMIPNKEVDRLQRVQNAAARVVLRIPKTEHITPALRRLHWLPVRLRIKYKILCLVHRCIYDTAPAPPYLSELVKRYAPARPLRSCEQFLLDQPTANRAMFGDRSFSVAGPRMWNDLPPVMRTVQCYNTFKQRLKTHLFTCF